MMHLEITQGGGISNVFPPAIASILPVMGIQEVEVKKRIGADGYEWVVENLRYTYGLDTYIHHPFGASLRKYSDGLWHHLGMAPLYVVDYHEYNTVRVKFLTDIPDYEIGYVKTYISVNPHINISGLAKLSEDTVYSVDGIPLYMYDKTTLEDVPFTIIGIDSLLTNYTNSSEYRAYVRCEHSNIGNVIVAASRILSYS